MSEPTGGGLGRPGSGRRGVLFDSGDVLMRPTSPSDAPATQAWRRWFGGPRFVATIHAHLPGLRLDGADRAFDAGMRYLDQRHHQPLRTVAEERELFSGFYRIVLQELGAPDPPPALLQELVEGGDDEVGMEPFPEVVGVLHRLHERGLRLGVLTENWPSVEAAYQRLGLRGLFHAFVISAQEARLKDDPELFAIACARMGLPAEAILFVDDWPPHVQTALAAGFQGAVLDRNGDAPAVPGLTYLTDLQDVERLATSATLPAPPARSGGGGRGVAMSVLFHITDQPTWRAAVASGLNRPAWPEQGGPVACWSAAAVEEVANVTSAGRQDLLLLRIDATALPGAPRIECDRPDREPVLLAGPLDLDAVVGVEQLSWDGERLVVDDEVAALAVQGDRTLAEAVAQAGAIMAGFDRAWWVAGGWTIDCVVGRRTRLHADLELAVLHRDHQTLFTHLAGWELRLARPGGDFARWDGTPLVSPVFHQFWARSGGGQAPTPREFVGDPSFVGFLLEASHQDTWLYRRHHAVTRPLAELGTRALGVPVLRPEIALLYKSRGPRRRDTRDLAVVLPRLDPHARAWLAAAVATAHPDSPWLARLQGP